MGRDSERETERERRKIKDPLPIRKFTITGSGVCSK
jgi:hypothetical protein